MMESEEGWGVDHSNLNAKGWQIPAQMPTVYEHRVSARVNMLHNVMTSKWSGDPGGPNCVETRLRKKIISPALGDEFRLFVEITVSCWLTLDKLSFLIINFIYFLFDYKHFLTSMAVTCLFSVETYGFNEHKGISYLQTFNLTLILIDISKIGK